MENVKMTNRLALEFALGLDQVKENQEVFDKLTKMLEQVEKKSKSTKDGKPTKAQEQNIKIKEVVLQVMARVKEPKQIKELLQESELKEYTNQKLSALLRQLVAEEKVLRIEEKKVAKFKLV